MLKQLNEVLSLDRGPLLPDGRVRPVLRILNGSLDEDPTSPRAIILNGRIDSSTLRFLKYDDEYQRDLAERGDIFEALKAGKVVPNIEIGVRGENFVTDGNDIVIEDAAYVIDGRQRVGNALRLMELIQGHPIRIFATVHFGTDRAWEMQRFTELNKNVKKVSPNLHLRNIRERNEAVLTLYGLSGNERGFVLYKKVSWGQNMKRGELITATSLAKVALRLHSHLAGLKGQNVELLGQALLVAAGKAGLNQFRKNVAMFFEVVEDCFGLRTIEFRASAPQIRQTFMDTLARMFSLHVDFWSSSERVFFVSSDARSKLAKFPIRDPHIANLAGSGGSARNLLYDHLIRHMDSGKRTGHLQPRGT